MNKLYAKIIFPFLFLEFSSALFSQNIAVNLSGNSGNAAAILDLSDASNSSLGFLMTNVDILNVNSPNPISSPPAGLIVWNTNTPNITTGGFGAGFYYWSGTKWFYINNTGNPNNISGSGTANYLARWISPSSLGTGVIQDNGTGVGISATVITPASLLDVKGNITIGTYAGINAAPANGMIVSGQMGVGTNSPNASAALDVTSASSGFLLPRMTTVQRNSIASPAQSLEIFNITDSCLEMYLGAIWQKIWCNGVTCTPASVSASASPNPICAGSTLTLTANAIGATSWSWSGPNSFHSSSQNSTILNITPAGAGTYTLTASNACGPATPVTFSVSVDPGIPSSITATANPNPICAGDTLTLTGGGANVATWSWSGPNSFASNLQSPTIGGIIVADSGKYTLTATNACGSAAPVKTVSVKVSTPPATPAIPSGSVSPVVNTTNTYTIAAVPGAVSYTWSSSNTSLGTITGGQGTTTATITTTATPGTFTICVHDSNTCGISSNSCLTVISTTCQPITLDQHVNGNGSNSLVISTTNPNELILISANSWFCTGPSIKVDGNAATLLDSTQNVEVFKYFAPLAGAHNIAVNQPCSPFTFNFAVSFIGGCNADVFLKSSGGPVTGTVSCTVNTSVPNSYLYATALTNSGCTSYPITFSGAGASTLDSYFIPCGINSGQGGAAEVSFGSFTVTATTSSPAGNLTMLLIAVEP